MEVWFFIRHVNVRWLRPGLLRTLGSAHWQMTLDVELVVSFRFWVSANSIQVSRERTLMERMLICWRRFGLERKVVSKTLGKECRLVGLVLGLAEIPDELGHDLCLA